MKHVDMAAWGQKIAEIALLKAENERLKGELDEMQKQWKLRAICGACGYIGVGTKHCAACDQFIPLRLGSDKLV